MIPALHHCSVLKDAWKHNKKTNVGQIQRDPSKVSEGVLKRLKLVPKPNVMVRSEISGAASLVEVWWCSGKVDGVKNVSSKFHHNSHETRSESKPWRTWTIIVKWVLLLWIYISVYTFTKQDFSCELHIFDSCSLTTCVRLSQNSSSCSLLVILMVFVSVIICKML